MRRVLYLFGELNDSDVDWLGDAGRVVNLTQGQTLILAGTAPSQIALLLDGELAVYLPSAPATPVARLQAGEIVGELTFLDPRPPLVTVSATVLSLVLQVPHQAIAARLARDLAFAARFYRGLGVFLASRLRETTGRVGVTTSSTVADQFLDADELDDDAMERTALAGRRFDFLCTKLGVR